MRQHYLSKRTPAKKFSSYAHKNNWGYTDCLLGKSSKLAANMNLKEILTGIL